MQSYWTIVRNNPASTSKAKWSNLELSDLQNQDHLSKEIFWKLCFCTVKGKKYSDSRENVIISSIELITMCEAHSKSANVYKQNY